MYAFTGPLDAVLSGLICYLCLMEAQVGGEGA